MLALSFEIPRKAVPEYSRYPTHQPAGLTIDIIPILILHNVCSAVLTKGVEYWTDLTCWYSKCSCLPFVHCHLRNYVFIWHPPWDSSVFRWSLYSINLVSCSRLLFLCCLALCLLYSFVHYFASCGLLLNVCLVLDCVRHLYISSLWIFFFFLLCLE